MRYLFYICFFFTSIEASLPQTQVSNEDKWFEFIENLQQRTKDVPKPFAAVDLLIRKYLIGKPGLVLDIGCETGKNAIPLIEAGHLVTLLDIAPNAISYTLENIQNLGLEYGVIECINAKIENLDQNTDLIKRLSVRMPLLLYLQKYLMK